MSEKQALVDFVTITSAVPEVCFSSGRGRCRIQYHAAPKTTNKTTAKAGLRYRDRIILCNQCSFSVTVGSGDCLLRRRGLARHVYDLHPAVDFGHRIGRILELALAVSNGHQVAAGNAG